MPKPIVPGAAGERVRIRPLEVRDLDKTLAWRNQPHIRRWFVHSAEVAPELHRAWFDSYSAKDNDFVFVIEERGPNGDRPVGQVALYAINRDQGSAEFGRLMIGESAASGRGLAAEATRLVLEVGRRYLGLRRFELEVFADNDRAIALYEKCGFVTFGTSHDGRLLKMALDVEDDSCP